MSETAVVKRLVDELILSLTGIKKEEDPDNFKLCQDYVHQTFRRHTFLAPDKFDTYTTLNGFVEHFDIISKSPIARALETRVETSRNLNYKYTAEVLAFLLHLSERPFDRKDLDDIEKFELERTKVVKELTWEDIIAENPLEGGDELWQNVDFGAESDLSYDSENDRQKAKLRRERRKEKAEEDAAKAEMPEEVVEEEEPEVDEEGRLECFIVQPKKESTDYLRVAQYWNVRVAPMKGEVDVSLDIEKNKDIWIVSEQQSIREVLFMLSGTPSSLFNNKENGEIKVYLDFPHVVQRFALRHASLETTVMALRWFAAQGNALKRLRAFSKSNSKLQNMQAFIAAVGEKVRILNRSLVDLQSRYVQTSSQPTSLLSLQTELAPLLHPYTLLSTITTSTSTSSLTSPHLNHLFTHASTAQITGDHLTFTFLSDVFFACLQSYLQPVREWMESGSLRADDKEFFVREVKGGNEVSLHTFWREQFMLVRDEAGALQVPVFLRPFAEKIFTTGKSVIFLKRLRNYEVPPVPAPSRVELSKEQVLEGCSDLVPFDQSFASALDLWIHSKHHSVGSHLREVLYKDCQLQPSLEALEYVYFFKDGTRLNLLTKTLFEKMDKGKEIWNDRFLLSELVQSVFTNLPCVDARSLTAKTNTKLLRPSQTLKKTIKLLAGLQIDYLLPWPIMNLFPPPFLTTYQSISTLLLQLSRTHQTLTPLLKYPLPRSASPLYHSLRHTLTAFVVTITSYLHHLVLIPQTEKLYQALDKVVDMDNMIAVIGRYTKRVREMCLLGKKLKPIHSALLSILELGVRFSSRWRAKAGSGRLGRRIKKKDEEDEGSEDEEYEDGGETSGWETETERLEGEGEERYLRETSEKLGRLVEFVRGGLKGVARAGVMPHLEMLGEELW